QVLYADIPGLVPTAPLPPNHHWLGPILWSPAVALPCWWEGLAADRPLIYVTLGSSGEGDRLLPIVFRALAELPVTVIAATAGRPLPAAVADNVRVADYLPGTEAAARSTLVICNGGSPTTQQALAAGVPVVGIAGNMDQHLNMLCLEDAGAGIRLRAGRLTADGLRAAVQRLLDDPAWRASAARLRRVIQDHDTGQAFRDLVAAQLHQPRREAGGHA
ncbi:MAG: glycosyl transferase family 1, partial [Pseudomonadota bacterium]|nr:glycosyl transferase family 1 [Pseudomonadota bacterium]